MVSFDTKKRIHRLRRFLRLSKSDRQRLAVSNEGTVCWLLFVEQTPSSS